MMTRRLTACVAVACWMCSGTSGDAQSVGYPQLPTQPLDYVGYAVDNLPAHFGDGEFLTATSGDNTPADNPITNDGAALGRVLFYDKRLSHNNSAACASCHQQDRGFADSSQFSTGFEGETTARNSMSLTNAKFYKNNRFFRDESAGSLEEQVLEPIQDPVELGSDLNQLVTELSATSFYPALFQAAFGSTEVTADRMGKAMSQFVRSMVSYQSKYDSAFAPDGTPRFEEVLTEQENVGRALFHGVGRCSFCHTSEAQVAVQAHNNGLDIVSEDQGAGDGKFKSVSLRNVATRDFFMHDGRFSTLEEVVDFYSSGIQDNPNLDFRLRDDERDNGPVQLDFTTDQKEALVAFLGTLTDETFINDPKFSNPFVLPCDFDDNELCDVRDLNQLLATGTVASGVSVTSGQERFDLDGSNFIDEKDVSRWLKVAAEANGLAAPYQRGDANLDGRADAADHEILQTNFFRETSDWTAGDFNGDGVADGSDFNLWNSAANSTAGAPNSDNIRHGADAFVPEPASLGHLMVASLTLLWWRCRSEHVTQQSQSAGKSDLPSTSIQRSTSLSC